MLLSLLYMAVRVLFRFAPAGDERDREAEILVLRHQVKVLQRKAGRLPASRAMTAWIISMCLIWASWKPS